MWVPVAMGKKKAVLSAQIRLQKWEKKNSLLYSFIPVSVNTCKCFPFFKIHLSRNETLGVISQQTYSPCGKQGAISIWLLTFTSSCVAKQPSSYPAAADASHYLPAPLAQQLASSSEDELGDSCDLCLSTSSVRWWRSAVSCGRQTPPCRNVSRLKS